MILKNWIASLGLLLTVLGLAGCVTDPNPIVANVPCSSDELQVGDLITVTFADLPPDKQLPEHKERIKDDGTLSLPFNVSVKAAGKKSGAVQQDIHDR